MYSDFVGRDSFYAYLAQEGENLFPDERFASWFSADNGRPCVSPCLLTKVLLLQMFDGCSDAEAVERATYDLRWKVALRVRPEVRPFVKSTLQMHRARIHLNEWAQNLLISTVERARQVGILKGSKISIVTDTTPVFGRGAVKDTFNLIADAIKNLCEALGETDKQSGESWASLHGLSRYWTSMSLKGDADIDWSSESERNIFLTGLVADADRVVLIAERTVTGLIKADEAAKAVPVQEALSVLKAIIVQDVERVPSVPDKETTPTPSQVTAAATDTAQSNSLEAGCKIKDGVAPDRLISVTDPDMRHGRKSASNRFDGHKAAIAVEPESQIITAVDVIPGNAADATNLLDLIAMTETATGAWVEKTIGDCAYGDGATRQTFADAERTLVAKVPAPPKDEPFHKAQFRIDLDNNQVTCPAGHTTTEWEWATAQATKGRPVPVLVKHFMFPASLCRSCPFFSKCVKGKRGAGRVVTLHPQEKLLQRAREYQATEAFLSDKRQRQAAEHRLARLVQLGIRQARYFGRAKTRLQVLLAAAVANLVRLAATAARLYASLIAVLLT